MKIFFYLNIVSIKNSLSNDTDLGININKNVKNGGTRFYWEFNLQYYYILTVRQNWDKQYKFGSLWCDKMNEKKICLFIHTEPINIEEMIYI